MNINFKKALLTGTALVAGTIAFANASYAVEVNMTGTISTSGLSDGNRLVTTAGSTTTNLNVDADRELGGSAESEENAIFFGHDNNSLYVYGDNTLTLSEGTDGNAISNGGAFNSIIVIGDNSDANNATANNIVVNGDVLAGAGSITFNNSANSFINVLTFDEAAETVDLGSGSIVLDGGDVADFDSTQAQTVTGTITDNAASGTVNIGNTNVSGVTFNDAVDVDNLTFEEDSHANFDANSTFVDMNLTTGSEIGGSGTIDTTNITKNDTGTATINNQLTATSGTTTVNDGRLEVNNAASQVNNVNLNGGTTVFSFGGSVITGAVTGDGTLDAAGDLTIIGDLGRIGTLDLGGATSVGNMEAADTTNIGTNTVTVTGTFDATSDNTLNFTVNESGTTAGQINASGIATISSGTNVNMTVETDTYVANDASFTLVDGANGGNVGDLSDNLTTTATALLRFEQDTHNEDDLVVVANRRQMQDVASNSNNAAVGAALEDLGADGDDDVDALQVRLQQQTTDEGVNDVLSTVTPSVTRGTTNATLNVSGSTSTIINNRIAGLRAGAGSGVSSGNIPEGMRMWGQAFGSTTDQDEREGIAGYESDAYGLIVGMDTEVNSNTRAGLAFAYGNSDVDGEDANTTEVDIDSYQVSLYSEMDLANDMYANAQLGYMYNDIDQQRNDVGAPGTTASADYHSNQFYARAEFGRQMMVDNGVVLTPSALVNYNFIDTSDYSESGAGGLSLTDVETDDLQILELGVNLAAQKTFEDGRGGLITPDVHVGYRYDVIGDNVATTAALSGGGAAFSTEGFDPAQSAFNIGAGVNWLTISNVEFSANYDYEYKEDYDAHSGYLRASYKF